MSEFTDFLVKVDDLVWGIPLIVLILAAGIYLTFRLRLLQIVHLPKALKYMFKNEEDGHGEVSSFGALCTALSATIGTGNIVGVATAIGCTALGTAVGGPGALFWMWVAAFFGMATKYAEGFLAVRYRTIDEEGHVLGGPFYYIENGMGHKWKWLAKVFAFFGACVGLFGIGTFTQVNGIASAVQSFFDPNKEDTVSILGNDYSIAIVITAFALAICVGLVVIGGIKRIASVSQVIVPFMAILYIVAVLVLIVTNIEKLPGALATIVEYAFGVKAVAGGVLSSIAISMQKGIARGIFSNEAGLGSAPIAAAAAQTRNPVRQALVSSTGTFWDTVVVCLMTGLVLVTSIMKNPAIDMGQITNGGVLTTLAFQQIPVLGPVILVVGIISFAYSTVLGWAYYGERCVEYFAGRKGLVPYRVLYIAVAVIAPVISLNLVWTIADILNALMALPNLVAVLLLSNVIVAETKKYINNLDAKDDTEIEIIDR